MEPNWQSVVGIIVSSGIGAWVVKELLQIKEQLAIVLVRLERMDRDQELIKEHDRKITAMEQVVYGTHWKTPTAPHLRKDHS